MNWIDGAMIVLLAISLASGLREGLSRSGFGFLALIAAFLCAAWLYPTKLSGFVVVFVGSIAAGGLATFLLGRWFKKTELNWLDRVLGGVLGVVNALLISVLGVAVLMAFARGSVRQSLTHSKFAPHALETAYRVAEVVPDEMKFRIRESYRELSKVFPPNVRSVIP
jgi:uncharacterized membrane protein required for colicin V production